MGRKYMLGRGLKLGWGTIKSLGCNKNNKLGWGKTHGGLGNNYWINKLSGLRKKLTWA